ncbi:MAG TPA: DoxX family protein [Syntrophorhabdaceae bacterium]|nr:DoxX family protein [Syntrophorhabdaceae bacterium]
MFRKFIYATGATWFLLPVRLSVGATFIAHGAQKLFGAFGGKGLVGTAAGFANMGINPSAFWAALAGCGEFFGGLLVLIGLGTRLGAFSICIVMIVAVLKVQWGFFFYPKGIEYSFSLLAGAFALLIAGAGPFSVDWGISKRIARSSERNKTSR